MEQSKQIIAWELLFILVFSSLLVIQSVEKNGLTFVAGKAVQGVTKDSILVELRDAVPKIDFIQQAGEFSMCLIVNIDQNTKYSYDVLKLDGTIAITSSNELYCKGQQNEDFVLYYLSYDKLKEHLTAKPSFQEFKKTGDGTNFYLYPSKQIRSGATLINPQEFNKRFGSIITANFNAEEIKKMVTVSEPETRAAASFASYLFYVIAGLVILVIVVLLLVFTRMKKPEVTEDLTLSSYIKSALSQGYSKEQIIASLVQSGWEQDKIDKAVKTVESEVTVPENFA